MAEHEAHVTQIAAEKAMRTARLAIPNFHLAHPPVSRCEHVVVKFWGNKYCRGLRCVGCKMELTRSHEQMVRVFFFWCFWCFLFFFALFIDLLTDKVQPLFKKAQIGTLSSEVEVMVQHHRHHEHGNYRSKDDKEYQLVCGERLRLEKTRREIYLMERSFYDVPMQQGVVDLYQMHMPDIANDAVKLSALLTQLTGSMAAGSMDAGEYVCYVRLYVPHCSV